MCFSESENQSCALGLGSEQFKKIEEVNLDKRGTSLSILSILERLKTFENAKYVRLKFKAFREPLRDIKESIAHDVYSYQRIPKNKHSFHSSYEITMVDYERDRQGVKTLSVVKY